jgi:predicted RNA binding protein YcfA (HicA-like mRNA interferase family)
MLPILSGVDVVRALERAGFHQASRKGSHVKMRNAAGRSAIVPMHREIAPGTLRSILRQAGLSADQLSEFL